MGKLSRQQLEDRVEALMPHVKVIRETPEALDAERGLPEAEASLPGVKVLKDRWLRYAQPRKTIHESTGRANRPVNVNFIRVLPAGGSMDPSIGPGPKTVIMDDEGNIIGAQG